MSDDYEFATDKSGLSERNLELLQLAVDTDHGTPLFKIRHFVGDAQITSYAKYKQILLELRAREEIIEQTLVTIEKNKATIELAREQIEEATSPARKKLAELDFISNTNDLMKTERRLSMAYTERENFLKVLDEMYETGQAYLADGTDMREAIGNTALDDQLEAEHWTYRLAKQAALDIMAYGHIGTGNMEAISMLNSEQAKDTLQLAIAYSHGVKGALGQLEAEVLEAMDSGRIDSTMKIEEQITPRKKELEQ